MPENAFVSIVPGCFSVNDRKLLGEIADGIKADNGRNFFDGQAGVLQKTGGLVAPFPIQKCDECHAHFLTELMG